jgi:hypothetical protein
MQGLWLTTLRLHQAGCPCSATALALQLLGTLHDGTTSSCSPKLAAAGCWPLLPTRCLLLLLLATSYWHCCCLLLACATCCPLLLPLLVVNFLAVRCALRLGLTVRRNSKQLTSSCTKKLSLFSARAFSAMLFNICRGRRKHSGSCSVSKHTNVCGRVGIAIQQTFRQPLSKQAHKCVRQNWHGEGTKARGLCIAACQACKPKLPSFALVAGQHMYGQATHWLLQTIQQLSSTFGC